MAFTTKNKRLKFSFISLLQFTMSSPVVLQQNIVCYMDGKTFVLMYCSLLYSHSYYIYFADYYVLSLGNRYGLTIPKSSKASAGKLGKSALIFQNDSSEEDEVDIT